MSFTYKGLSATLDRHIVTDTEVEQQLRRLQQSSPRVAVIKDRPTELGDEVVLDYAGFCDGVQFPGGTAQNQSLVLGSGMFIPGFEEQLVDKVPGEQVSVKVTFPTEYHSQELAGKEATFECTLHEIRVSTPYELDDTFAKEIGECDTIAQMRAKLKESLQAYSDDRGEMDLQDRLLLEAASTLDCSFTDAQLQEAMDTQMETLKAQLAQQGLSMEMYCAFLKTDEATLREESRQNAEAALRGTAAVEKIAALEGLEATKEELADALAVVCRQNNMTMEQIKPFYNEEFEKALSRGVLTTKAMELIRQNATVTVVES